jgi:hypothetical protein
MQSKKRGKTHFFDLTTNKNLWCRPPAMTDAFQNIKSGMHVCFPEYIFQINAIMVNEGKVGTSCRAKGIPECKIRNASTLDYFERELGFFSKRAINVGRDGCNH